MLHLGGAPGILVTMDAEQGVECLRNVRPDIAIPIHQNDYDIVKDPLENFAHAVEHAGWNKARHLHHGESFAFLPRAARAVETPALPGAPLA